MSSLPARSSTDKWLTGVCGGLAKSMGADPNLVRLLTALAVLFTGVGPLAYIGAWVLMPDEATGRSLLSSWTSGKGQGSINQSYPTSQPGPAPQQPDSYEQPKFDSK